MPEIASGKTGYLVAMAVTGVSTLGTILYFKIKKWL
jgi:Mg2+ and Co2+ transporter CorA